MGEAIADGIAGRQRVVCVPGWVRAVLAARTAVRPLVERDWMRQAPGWQREIDERLQAGGPDVMRPVGPGGEAAMRAAEARSTRS